MIRAIIHDSVAYFSKVFEEQTDMGKARAFTLMALSHTRCHVKLCRVNDDMCKIKSPST